MDDKSLLELLDGQTFSGGQVQKAVGANAALVNRLCNTYQLELFSEESTQGRSRDYCLADVEQLALALQLGRMTARPKRVAAALNTLAGFQGSIASRPGDDSDQSFKYRVANLEENRALRLAARETVKALPSYFWAEDRPIFIHIWPDFANQDIIDEAEPSLRDGLFLNAARHLSFVRLRLAETVKAN